MVINKLISATGNILVQASNPYTVSRLIVDFKNTGGGGSFSIKPQKRLAVLPNSDGTAVTPNSFADCWYTLADSTAQVAAATTQTADGLLDIDISGCDCQLVVTIVAPATVQVYAQTLIG